MIQHNSILINMNQQQPAAVVVMDEYLSTQTHNNLMSTSTLNPSTTPPPPPPPPAKRKRSLPGHPDPDAEVIAMSPKSLLATNRFMCEICNKGFRRDQNLQLHRRGHNLPWKLKQRPRDEAVRKKVYVCPEAGCVHNDPARALGDLTGIKKHFYRKHGEKKWKCDKCTKKYAVHSDWKAHSKTCGTKDYKCHCGTLFSRRDSFITHKAFCDALVEDTSRALISNPFLPAQPPQLEEVGANYHHQSPIGTSSSTHQNMHQPPPTFILQNPDPQLLPQQPHPENIHTHIPNLNPTWLPSSSPELLFSHELMQPPLQNPSHVDIGGSNSGFPNPGSTAYLPPPPPHMSATALLQKAAQLGSILSSKTASASLPAGVTAQPPPMTAVFGLNLSSLEQEMGNNTTLGFFSQGGGVGGGVGTLSGLSSFGHIAATAPCGVGEAAGGPTSSSTVCGAGGGGSSSSSSSSLLRDLMMMKSSFDGDNAFDNGGINDGLTRDFLGLRPLIPHGDIANLRMDGQLGDTNVASSSSQEHEKAW